jgi:hypothetical protein
MASGTLRLTLAPQKSKPGFSSSWNRYNMSKEKKERRERRKKGKRKKEGCQ